MMFQQLINLLFKPKFDELCSSIFMELNELTTVAPLCSIIKSGKLTEGSVAAIKTVAIQRANKCSRILDKAVKLQQAAVDKYERDMANIAATAIAKEINKINKDLIEASERIYDL